MVNIGGTVNFGGTSAIGDLLPPGHQTPTCGHFKHEMKLHAFERPGRRNVRTDLSEAAIGASAESSDAEEESGHRLQSDNC